MFPVLGCPCRRIANVLAVLILVGGIDVWHSEGLGFSGVWGSGRGSVNFCSDFGTATALALQRHLHMKPQTLNPKPEAQFLRSSCREFDFS